MTGAQSNDGRDDLPRISIDSLCDWQRIQENYTNAAFATLDKKLAEQGLASQRDIYLQHITQFITRTFEIARPNLRVNGRNLEDINDDDEEEEQFDEALDRRVHSLATQRDSWDLEIALKRRTAPTEVAMLMCDLVARQKEHELSVIAEDIAELDVEMEDADQDADEVHHRTFTLLANLKKDVLEQQERSGRIKEVDKEIRSLKL